MSLVLYNTFSKHEEEFLPVKKGTVSMYTCGPTVYSRPHIGNYSSFLMADLLRRWLQTGHGLMVKHVKNITDVGHLLHDADHGDDKIQREAEREKLHPLEIARRYTEQYLEDERALNMLEPDARPRASEFIPHMLRIIKTLLEKKNAYETEDGIYFNVKTFPQYGALSGNTLANLSAGKRVEINEKKKHPADFALWKKCIGDNARHVLRWKFSNGTLSRSSGEDSSSGFPGWHIECSAMSSSLLGETIDIHTGGEDNIFPHHECEIAQSESAFGGRFVRMWLHKRRIDLGDAKMSKSLGNVLQLPDLIEKGYSPLDVRYFLLSVHYRTNVKCSWKGLDDAKIARRTVADWIARAGVGEYASDPARLPLLTADILEECEEDFHAAMDSDLNTPAALAVVFTAIHLANTHRSPDASAREKLAWFMHSVADTFGCFEREESSVPSAVMKLITEREAARQEKDFAQSDRLREAIRKMGFEVKDTPQGPIIRKAI